MVETGHRDRKGGGRRIQRPITSGPDPAHRHEGHALWEPIEVMRLRNRRVTLAYSDLSQRLAALIAGDEGALSSRGRAHADRRSA